MQAAVVAPEALLGEQKRLRQRLVEPSSRGGPGRWPAADLRGLAAQLILYLDDEHEIWRQGTLWLREKTGVDRADSGPVQSRDRYYRMGYAESLGPAAPPSVAGAIVDWYHPLMAGLAQSSEPVAYANLLDHQLVDPHLRSTFVRLGTRAKLAMLLRDDQGPLGLMCLDRTDAVHEWADADLRLLEVSVTEVLVPVLRTAAELGQHDASAAAGPQQRAESPPKLASLSKAELRVLHFTAQGLSYKETARSLSRSTATIDHQLRSIRHKLGVASNRQLLTLIATLDPKQRDVLGRPRP